jgi:hypothetical protein
MNKSLIFALTISLFFYRNIQTVNCQTVKSKTVSYNSKEHQKLLLLVRNLYKWKETTDERNYEFYSLDNKNPKDTLVHGLDMKWNQKRIVEFKRTGFFSTGFIENYNRIAITIDKNLKNGDLKWFTYEGLSPFGGDSNLWCDCQDTPIDKHWNFITLKNLKFNKKVATFYWVWGLNSQSWRGDPKSFGEHKYKVKAIKENGVWKILYLQRFDFEELTKIENY